ncbi:hypothetical protein, partial [Gillisia marina]|uniref:hypothetical protein n=1 Tax=Gillisia marina TaxID=1167637 RepID=UPI000527FE05
MGKITLMVRTIAYLLLIFGSSNYIFGINSSNLDNDFSNTGEVFALLVESRDIVSLELNNSGLETFTATNCKTTSTNDSVYFAKPTIALQTIPTICKGKPTVNLSYTGTTQSPTKYSIIFSATAKAQGFSDVIDKSHTFNSGGGEGNISINIPSGAGNGTYTATFFVSNTEKGDDKTITITISDNQDPTITAPANVSANTDSGKCTATG